jgi:hypothetical protein
MISALASHVLDQPVPNAISVGDLRPRFQHVASQQIGMTGAPELGIAVIVDHDAFRTPKHDDGNRGHLRSNAVAILRLAGHSSMGPTGVVAQSKALISEASSPPPLRKFRDAAEEVGTSCSFDSVRSLYASEKSDPFISS